MNTHPVTGSKPTVDVLVATQNRPELLRIALDAIWNQTYDGQISCVVTYDQTTPDTSLERTSDNRSIRVVSNRRAPGLAGARNNGIEASQGELVSFCDDDDSWMPEKIERQVAAVVSTGSATSVTGIIVRYDGHEVRRVPTRDDVTYEQLIRRRVMEAHPSTVLVRRDALLGPIGLVDEQIPGGYAEDYDWMLRAARAGDFAVVEEPLVVVQWGQSLFAQRWQMIIDALDYLVDKHPDFIADRRAIGRIRGQRAFALASLGRRRDAVAESVRALRSSPREARAVLALAVSAGIVSSERVVRELNTRGRGI